MNKPTEMDKATALDIIKAASTLTDRCAMDHLSVNGTTQDALLEQTMYSLTMDDIANLGHLVDQMAAILRNK